MSRFARRVKQNLALLLGSAAVGFALYGIVRSADPVFRWSMSSGYTALALLVFTLAIGPYRALRGSTTSLSNDLRRDVGIWACLWSVFHTVMGLQVHMRGKMAEYFLTPGEGPVFTRLRSDLFGSANYTGLFATALVILLAILSNDQSLRLLGAHTWKRLQQTNYLCFALVLVHAVLFQLVETRVAPYAIALGFLAAIAMSLQAARAMLATTAKKNPLVTGA
jgi:methionine sulfoxide reductase heme-binding subunit